MLSIKHHYDNGICLNKDLPIYLFEGFLDDETCKHFIDLAKDNLEKASVTVGSERVMTSGRTSQVYWAKKDLDDVTMKLAQRLSDLVEIPLENAEKFQILKYERSGEYRHHYDAWEMGSKTANHFASDNFGGQRLITCVMYLNTVPSGGGTDFKKANVTVDAKKGDMVLFHNCFNGTRKRNPLSLHAGLPVIKGEKWTVVLWFREKEFKK